MIISSNYHTANFRGFRMAIGLVALGLAIAGCGSGPGERASQMTSYSSKESKDATPDSSPFRRIRCRTCRSSRFRRRS